ncbi:hypothetical protein Rmet_6747 (plasmid) [Cupriavidus metallidurans CH34]|uniref:Uncharacterized protein n=1 Tax=Cupriavidus metallidurans (strain ATCC 43123 / DSM 2839 / NBRC 102507 / CH34) TaxID=266264 RepID=D3DYF6_CUPMC|nr:hypothetical protein Rmet_6747 [Cupriavidus metallidurans CH34]
MPHSPWRNTQCPSDGCAMATNQLNAGQSRFRPNSNLIGKVADTSKKALDALIPRVTMTSYHICEVGDE